MYKSREEKKLWAQNLRAGDQVEDCRMKICTIKKIEHRYTWPEWVHKLAMLSLTPEDMGLFSIPAKAEIRWMNSIYEAAPYFASRNQYVDSDLILEDGESCSAMNCCDKVIHNKPILDNVVF